jgi:5'-3' exonuclease
VNKPTNITKVVIDGDIIAYRCSISAQEYPFGECANRIDDMMDYCINQTVGFDLGTNHLTFLTGKDNFRNEVSKTYHYKGNRKDTEKPQHLEPARGYLVDKWGAEVINGREADDAIAETAYGTPNSVIVSVDKDFLTVPGWMYNFVKDTWTYSTEEMALEFFYTQILTGDTADNIVGLYRIGPKKAGQILDGWTTEKELFDKTLEAYKNSETLIGDPYERLLENARLLHLCRYEGEVWKPPE